MRMRLIGGAEARRLTWNRLLSAEPRSKILRTSPVFFFVCHASERLSRWSKHIVDILKSADCMTG
jgi:hypothetical protein